MNINRHNYEEFFLLYVDNELQPDQRVQVETFVQQHPDLALELTMLRQATFANVEVLHPGKSKLFKTPKGISLSNYEAYFLLAVDNELTATEAADVDRFVLQHPDLQQHFTQLMQTRLTTEVVVFTDKQSLYRKEKARRLVTVSFMRISVAAALLGFVVMSWLYVANHSSQQPALGSAKPGANIVNKNFPSNQSTAVTKSNAAPLHSLEKEKHVNDAIVLTQKVFLKKPLVKQVASVYSGVVLGKEENKKDEQRAETFQLKLVNRNQTLESYHEPQMVIKQEEKSNGSNDVKASLVVNSNVQQPSLVSNAVYLNTDDNSDEDRNIYIGNTSINKNKFKGLFKKASTLFRKKKAVDEL